MQVLTGEGSVKIGVRMSSEHKQMMEDNRWKIRMTISEYIRHLITEDYNTNGMDSASENGTDGETQRSG